MSNVPFYIALCTGEIDWEKFYYKKLSEIKLPVVCEKKLQDLTYEMIEQMECIQLIVFGKAYGSNTTTRSLLQNNTVIACSYFHSFLLALDVIRRNNWFENSYVFPVFIKYASAVLTGEMSVKVTLKVLGMQDLYLLFYLLIKLIEQMDKCNVEINDERAKGNVMTLINWVHEECYARNLKEVEKNFG